MWNKEVAQAQRVPDIAPASAGLTLATPANVSPRVAACISQGIRITGEVTGSEDLLVDGQVDGKVNLANGSLTIGPNGHLKAEVTAREVIVRGRIEGKVAGRERIQLWSTGRVEGEMRTERLAVEDGAVLRGTVEAGRVVGKAAEIRAARAPAMGGKGPGSLSAGRGAD